VEKYIKIVCLLFLLVPAPVTAELPGRMGFGIDYFQMQQDYSIDSLSFSIPGMNLPGVDTSAIKVDSDLRYVDLKVDSWILPYLNLFAILGKVDGSTDVDFSGAGLPIPITDIEVDYDGNVLGAGATLIIGYEQFFGSLTATYTYTHLSGDFDSSFQSWTLQPRVGMNINSFLIWIGGMYLNVDESHQGNIQISGLGSVEFDIDLDEADAFSPTAGIGYHFGKHFEISFEVGFGDRDTIFTNFTYRP
jgi:hypothetical protein